MDIISISEASQLLKISRQALHSLCNRHNIQKYNIDGTVIQAPGRPSQHNIKLVDFDIIKQIHKEQRKRKSRKPNPTNPQCKYCQSLNVVKNGFALAGKRVAAKQLYFCNHCRKNFR